MHTEKQNKTQDNLFTCSPLVSSVASVMKPDFWSMSSDLGAHAEWSHGVCQYLGWVGEA